MNHDEQVERVMSDAEWDELEAFHQRKKDDSELLTAEWLEDHQWQGSAPGRRWKEFRDKSFGFELVLVEEPVGWFVYLALRFESIQRDTKPIKLPTIIKTRGQLRSLIIGLGGTES